MLLGVGVADGVGVGVAEAVAVAWGAMVAVGSPLRLTGVTMALAQKATATAITTARIVMRTGSARSDRRWGTPDRPP